MSKAQLNRALGAFIDASPTPFHACANMRGRLLQAGFANLDEAGVWQLKRGGKYLVTRNDSSLIAFRLGAKAPAEDGLRMIGAHTDSPCLKLKPNAVVEQAGYVTFGVEVYGGVLLNPWFDRDLSVAGRVTLKNRRGQIRSTLVDLREPVAIIPSLAIHLDREANAQRSINQQTMLPPVVALAGSKAFDLGAVLKQHIKANGGLGPGEAVLDFELSLYATQGVASIGLKQEFIAGARLDNLLSCYAGLDALLGTRAGHGQLLVCNDHEEVGSGSSAGARGNFLRSVLERIAGTDEDYARMIARSMLVSTDNAHGIHPNFADRHDARHGPLLNAGPVIKVNSNQAYATNSETAAVLRHAAAIAKVKLQSFVVRTDMACGSTIGPLTATALGVRTVDVGVPTFAMHSIRELAGSDDADALRRLLKAFYALPTVAVACGD
jgi:aspartyl aminopeptidase